MKRLNEFQSGVSREFDASNETQEPRYINKLRNTRSVLRFIFSARQVRGEGQNWKR